MTTQAVVEQSLDKFEFWKTSLQTLALQLEDWEHEARRRAMSEEADDG